MQKLGGKLQASASDLVGHLNCGHLTGLDLAVAAGNLEKPKVWDPLLEILRERGARHEREFVEKLKAQGIHVTVVDGVGVDDNAIARTRQAMAAGDDVIVQAAFRHNGWVGRADVLRRVETPSALGAWSYEVIDTKLARETKGGTVLQLCLYADLVASVQGSHPEYSYVVIPGTNFAPESYRMADYAAYYRRVRDAFETAVVDPAGADIYPDPKEHCDVCRWQDRCDKRRRADDHLSLVAGISKVNIDELKRRGVDTVANLAAMPTPLTWKPARGAAHSYERIREQARIQVEGREAGAVIYELLPVTPGFGLACLPEPSPGDVFLDLEGDPFAGEGGLEYMFGYAFGAKASDPDYTADWALTRDEERKIFERFIDFVMDRLKAFPELHVYHYAPYEPGALKRLMGRYATREEEVDYLLRSRRFVDLYGVVRGALRASVESYSIKRLEPLYAFTREMPLQKANIALTKIQACLELSDAASIEQADREAVTTYNRDDCLSTWWLRDWLELRRTELVASGVPVPRPEVPDGAPSESLSEWQLKVNELIKRLTHDIPADVAERAPEQQARWILAYSLDFHRREDKAAWWEFFRLSDLTAEDLLDERAGLAGLVFAGTRGGTAKAPIHRYAFPSQEAEVRAGDDLRSSGGALLGKVEAISLDEHWIDIKKRGDTADFHPEAVFAHMVIDTKVLAEALVRIAEYVADHGMEGDGPYQAARDLLMRMPPRIGGELIQKHGESTLDAAVRIATSIGPGIFPIQGPPGAGKTHTGARMICALVKSGKTVGVTANSHKVIRNLLDAVLEAAEKTGVDLCCIQKPGEMETDQPRLTFAKNSAALLKAIGSSADVAGATAWLWAAPSATQAVDVLFVDEAAQMALAKVLAVSQAAKTVVLLGDPQQLDQPMQGSHPEGTDVSALHHILGEEQTITDEQGLFLAETWRLHPDICAYTSELFYEGRLHPRPGLELQAVRSSGRLQGTGLRYVAVPTQGNQNSSPEEADCVRALVNDILESKATWIDKNGKEEAVTLKDILIIAPYNAQVFELMDRLPGARIGTVDKFQGQEAPIVIYSMTTSSHADAPRGMEFLYSLNRLNVATSRAKCLCVLVASPSVLEAQCRTPRQMQLANAYCRYLELAQPVAAPDSATASACGSRA